MTSGIGSGSISLSGLLGGTAGSIDTTALISSLMQAASIPQTQLKDQLTTQQGLMMAYQAINTKLTAMQTAAQAMTDPTAWTADRGDIIGRQRRSHQRWHRDSRVDDLQRHSHRRPADQLDRSGRQRQRRQQPGRRYHDHRRRRDGARDLAHHRISK